jgi:hypothetical protein
MKTAKMPPLHDMRRIVAHRSGAIDAAGGERWSLKFHPTNGVAHRGGGCSVPDVSATIGRILL